MLNLILLNVEFNIQVNDIQSTQTILLLNVELNIQVNDIQSTQTIFILFHS